MSRRAPTSTPGAARGSPPASPTIGSRQPARASAAATTPARARRDPAPPRGTARGAPGGDPGDVSPPPPADRRRLLGHHGVHAHAWRRHHDRGDGVRPAGRSRRRRPGLVRARQPVRERVRARVPAVRRARARPSPNSGGASPQLRERVEARRRRAHAGSSRARARRERPVGRGRRCAPTRPMPTGPRSRGDAFEPVDEALTAPRRHNTSRPVRAPDRYGRPEGRGPSGACMHFNLADLWERVADTVPDHEALVDGDRRFTFAELDDARDRLAHALAAARASEPATTSPSTSTTRSSTSRRCSPRSSCARYRSTSTTATSRTSCATSSPTATRARSCSTREFAPKLARDPRVAAAAADVRRRRRRPRRRRERRRPRRDRVRSRARGASPGARLRRRAPATTSTSSTPAARPGCPRA